MIENPNEKTVQKEVKPESSTKKIIRYVIGGLAVAGLIALFVAMAMKR